MLADKLSKKYFKQLGSHPAPYFTGLFLQKNNKWQMVLNQTAKALKHPN